VAQKAKVQSKKTAAQRRQYIVKAHRGAVFAENSGDNTPRGLRKQAASKQVDGVRKG
jgi:hypothetical protein